MTTTAPTTVHPGPPGRHRPRRTIVVTGIDRPAGEVVADLVAQRGLEVIGLPAAAGRAAADDPGAEATPTGGDGPPFPVGGSYVSRPAYVPAIARLVAATRPCLIIPTVRDELADVAAARSMLEALGTRVLVAGPGPVALSQDRLVMAAHLRSRGVPVPVVAVPSDFTTPDEALDHFGGALIATPRSIRCHRRDLLVTHPAEVDWDGLDDSWLLCEAVTPDVYTAVVHRPLHGRDTRQVAVVHERAGGSLSVLAARVGLDLRGTARVVVEPAIERLVMTAVRALGITGPADVSVGMTPAGQAVVVGMAAAFSPHIRLAPEILDAAITSALSADRAPHGHEPVGA